MKRLSNLALLVLVSFLALGIVNKPASALEIGLGGGQTQTQGSYYLTSSLFSASTAPFACQAGYHMASFAELQDTSVLQYASNMSFVFNSNEDQGQGPPFGVPGWIRSGYPASSTANCAGWTSNLSNTTGSAAEFALCPAPGSPGNTSTQCFILNLTPCSQALPVWCVMPPPPQSGCTFELTGIVIDSNTRPL